MPDGSEKKIFALIFLPLFYNPDAEGRKEPVEAEKIAITAEEIAKKFEAEF